MKWNKQTLADSINQRIDKNIIKGGDFIMIADLTDKIVEHFQLRWDSFVHSNPAQAEIEYQRLYDHIKKGWEAQDGKED